MKSKHPLRQSLLFVSLFLLCGHSAEARKLVFTRGRTLYSVEITDAGAIRRESKPQALYTAVQGMALSDLAVSRDGKFVAFCTRLDRPEVLPMVQTGITATCAIHKRSWQEDDETRTLWIMTAKAGATPSKLGAGFAPTFSPSGHRMAYTASLSDSQTGVCVRDMRTRRSLTLREKAHDPHWCANGREIALIDEHDEKTATILIVDAATGTQIRFRHAAGINGYNPMPSPDGRWIAFNPHLSRPKLSGVVVGRFSSQSFSLPWPGEPILDWSPDSRRLLWRRQIENERTERWDSGGLWISSLDGTQARKVSRDEEARFTPDGRHLLLLRSRSRPNEASFPIYIADMRGKRRLLLRDVSNFAL